MAALSPQSSSSASQRPSRSALGIVVQFLGEALITVGLILVLFVVWQLWWTNLAADKAQAETVDNLKQSFQGPSQPAGPPKEDYGEPAVAKAPAHGQGIGILYIPRFGKDYERPIIEGTSSDVLDTLGIGRYSSTAMPGAVGNFAVAGHRQTNGKVLDQIDQLVTGDKIYVRTADGYYTYTFRNNEIVLPTQTDVLAPVPGHPGEKPKDRIMTLTSCNPRFGSSERMIAYAVMEKWQPNSAGPPAEIADHVAKEK